MQGLGHILWTWQYQQSGDDELIHLGPDPDWDSHCSLQTHSEHSTGPIKSLLLGLLSLTHHQHWSLLKGHNVREKKSAQVANLEPRLLNLVTKMQER